jgi:hypothetical protein
MQPSSDARATHRTHRQRLGASQLSVAWSRLNHEGATDGDTEITLVGNLVDEPELRFTPSGVAVAKFRVASTPRTFGRETNEWKDGDSLFLTCNVWRQAAEHVAESLEKGMRVIVRGRLRQRRCDGSPAELRPGPPPTAHRQNTMSCA